MAEASMMEVFHAKVASFNNALGRNDTYEIVSIGAEILRLALDESVKPGVSASVKDMYRKSGLAVLSHLARLAQNPPVLARTGGESADGDSADPYYVTKQWFSDEVPNLGFADIIGVQEVKDAFMTDIVAPLSPEFRDIYRRFRGDQMGSQILLFGPPGTGKTHIVKCLAGALNCKIAVVQTSEVLASVVGVAEKNVRDIFRQAAELDRCIIFLDEIDSICSDRSSDDSRNTKSVLTTLLTCMDGFMRNTRPGQLRIIVAATNLPWKLDSALKRGGRFETQIYVPLPDGTARAQFISQGLACVPHDADVTVKWLAEELSGYSGADIKAVLRQIANEPLRREIRNKLNPNIGGERGEKIERADCEKVIRNYINPITPEMLLRFEAYDRGVSYEELIRIINGKK